MGGEPYWYFVKYNRDIQAALDQLRKQEFAAGRYNPVMDHLQFPMGPASPAPGARHKTIDEAREEAAEDGTRSVLDIEKVGDEPDHCVACPLGDAALNLLYGTTQPTRRMVEENLDSLLENVERGKCVYVIIHENGRAEEILFAGYSFD